MQLVIACRSQNYILLYIHEKKILHNKIKRPIYYRYDYRKIRAQLKDDRINAGAFLFQGRILQTMGTNKQN